MRFLWLLVFFAFQGLLKAQLSNAFFLREPAAPVTNHAFTFEALQYLKNNEYFNAINPGETLFGFQGKALYHYKITPNTTLSAGALVQKDFGDQGFLSKAYPLLYFQIKKGVWDMQLGNIKPHVQHRLIEPLLHYENIITQPVEYGLQARRESPGHFYDVWLNWQQRANKEKSIQEHIVFGQSLEYPWFRNKSFALYNPFQLIVYHQGGQSLNIASHIRTIANAATGLRLVVGDSIQAILEGFVIASADNSPTLSQPFKNGWASLSNLRFKLKYHELALSWWYSREFTTAIGSPVFNNVNLNDVYINSNTRRLAMLRYVYSRPIAGKHLWIDFRLEPYYDFEKSALEFSQGLYFRYVSTLNIKLPRWFGH